MFLTIQGGSHTININQISEIDWTNEGYATVKMATGAEYDIDQGDGFEELQKLVGIIPTTGAQ